MDRRVPGAAAVLPMKPRTGALCSVRGCYERAIAACEHPTIVKFQPATCGRALCAKHSSETRACSSSEPRTWCAEHRELIRHKGEPPPPAAVVKQGDLF